VRGAVCIAGLKVDYTECPLGLENRIPRLSWRLESRERNVRQRAYRILVASSLSRLQSSLGDLWDTGWIGSRQSFGVRYEGSPLASRQRCWWQVQVQEEAGDTFVSAPGWWEMGLLEATDWVAQWLAVESPVARADREAGLHWIWGSDKEPSSRAFRFTFDLPEDARSGELLAVGRTVDRIGQISLDGAKLGDDSDSDQGTGHTIALGPLSAGKHVVAIEVYIDTSSMVPAIATLPFVHGLAVLLRLDLNGGRAVRFSSRSGWKTAEAAEEDWRSRTFDDARWAPATCVTATDQPWPSRPALHLRRQFVVSQHVSTARLYVTALGVYEARINGYRVGDALLTPEVSQFAERVLYQVYDVTDLIQQGANVVGVTVGDGWYASFDGNFAWADPPRRLLIQLEITLSDGTRQVIASGPGWRTAESAIRESRMRVGEIYDARFEQRGWDVADFDDSCWWAGHLAEVPPCRLVAQMSPPIRATQVLGPRDIHSPRPGVYVVDFGQNFSGWCRLRARGAPGVRIELRFAELLSVAGEIDQSSMGVDVLEREAKRDVFILRGAGIETLEPHFTYRGFRYVEVTGLAEAPTRRDIEGVVVHSDLAECGFLRSGAELIEQLWCDTLWTQRSNFIGIATDCPHREQLGYLGDAGIFWDAAAFNMDVASFTSRRMDDIQDEQRPDGAFPIVAPVPRHDLVVNVNESVPVWADAAIILPWTAWRRYGDTALIERSWDAMRRYLEYIQNANPDCLWSHRRGYDFGDWLAVGENGFFDLHSEPTTPKELIATAYWAHSADLMAQMAEAIDRMGDARLFREMHERVRQAFNAKFVQSDGTVGNGSQTSYILALRFQLLREELRPRAAAKLAADVRGRGIALTAGIVGTQFSLDVLADAGYSDLAYGLLLRTEYPSWGYMRRCGATTIWENWSGELAYDGKVVRKISRNHFALGSVCGFLFRQMGGIDAAAPGFTTIVIRPLIDARIQRGGADYDSILGRISTDWSHRSPDSFTLDVTIPANASARIHLPARVESRIEEGGQDVTRHEHVRVVRRVDEEIVLAVDSGSYHFQVDTVAR
jgi:alpha-L-rhamnosidase